MLARRFLALPFSRSRKATLAVARVFERSPGRAALSWPLPRGAVGSDRLAMGAAAGTGSPPRPWRGSEPAACSALGAAVAARVDFTSRQKLLMLVCAYACVAVIVLCTYLAPSGACATRLGDEDVPDPDHLADPCTAQDSSQRHLGVQELREALRTLSLAALLELLCCARSRSAVQRAQAARSKYLLYLHPAIVSPRRR